MNPITLTTLSQQISLVLQQELDESYWVQAEIASLMVKNGHAYFDLVEKAPSGILSAKVRATCWANLYPMLKAFFQEETGSELQVGMQVLIEVEVNYHAVYGLAINIINIDPSYTIGDMARQRQQTILQLQREGIFDMQKSLTLPTLVRRIAIISSHQAAGYEDFIHQLESSPYRFHHTLFPATMQGDSAAASILSAMQQIVDQMEQFDAVVIIRGGGASIDLGCFDDYQICCHGAQFPLPLICGLGHTRDISILDMVAFLSLKTPTAAADFLIDRFVMQQERITQLRLRLQQTAQRQVMLRRHRIELLRQAIVMLSPERIYQKGYSLLTQDGHIVRSIRDIHSGQTIESHLQDGTIQSIVV